MSIPYILNATNIHISVNDMWLDRAVSITFQKQATHQMVYGYMDVDPRRPIKGNIIIVGTVGIHHLSGDYLKRYLTNAADPNRKYREEKLEYYHSMARQMTSDVELLDFMTTLDLSSGEWDEFSAVVAKERANVELPQHLQGNAPQTASAVDEDGFNQSIRSTDGSLRLDSAPKAVNTGKNRRYAGNTITIHYGDTDEYRFDEKLYGVVFTGEAVSPIENTAGVSADPVMRYFSFIAARVDPVKA